VVATLPIKSGDNNVCVLDHLLSLFIDLLV